MLARGAILLALAVCVSPAMAEPASSSFEVAPTTIDLTPGKPGLFYIANRGVDAVSIQIQTMDWRQQGDADSLTPSASLYASPPLVQVAPGERQVVRLLADPANAAHESEYRLIVSQLPQGAANGNSVQILLQFSIPVFVRNDASPNPRIVWSAVQTGKDVQITAHNEGDAAVKLVAMQWSAPGISQAPIANGLAYLLPGGTRSWRLALAGSTPSLRLMARDERSGTTLDTDVVLRR